MKTTERAVIIGGRVRQAVAEAGINNSELARRTGLQRRTIVRLANGHNEPDTETLEKIATATGKSLNFFAIGDPGPSAKIVEAVSALYSALLEDVRETIASEARPRDEVAA